MSSTAAVQVERFMADERAAVDRALRRFGAHLVAEAPATLAEPIVYALDAGGKRLRPVMCVAAYRAVSGSSRDRRREGSEIGGSDRPEAPGAGGDPDAASDHAIYDLSCALELIHTYSLVHDDLPSMDDDDLRRGRATTHRVFGEARVMVCGAALIPLACRTAVAAARRLRLSESSAGRLVTELCAAAGAAGMVGGQLMDLEAEQRSISIEELEAVHHRKTAALLAASLRIGGLAGGAGGSELSALDRYGRALGLAFQIADDVLDETGRSEAIGKTAGRDRELGKATYPALIGIESSRRTARELAAAGAAALSDAGLLTPELDALARYTVDRDR